ncbi:MAG: flagellar assembly protein FliW [Deltaproteobacteria bacterium]|nr:flagellar assembly protein FliW [Deltaproteobacteria bacterium]
MEIKTTRFGQVEINENLVITLPEGILGFEDFKRYIILDHFDKESPFKWFQSIDDPSLAFVITDPLMFVPEYKAKVSKEEIRNIKLSDASKSVIVVIVNIKIDHSEITINLQGPIVINPEEKLAKQVIIRESDYSVRHVIFSKEQNGTIGTKTSNCQKVTNTHPL